MPIPLQILFAIACVVFAIVPLAVSSWVALREADRSLALEELLELTRESAQPS